MTAPSDDIVLPLPPLSDELLGGGTAATWSDSRRFPRFQAGSQCLLQTRQTYAPCGHASPSRQVWLRDLARGGVRFLHAQQLFPGEQCELHVGAQAKKPLEIIWCRQLSPGVFMSGGQFVGGN
jgi:hypothetical protein